MLRHISRIADAIRYGDYKTKKKTQKMYGPARCYICNVMVFWVVVGYMYKYTKFMGL